MRYSLPLSLLLVTAPVAGMAESADNAAKMAQQQVVATDDPLAQRVAEQIREQTGAQRVKVSVRDKVAILEGVVQSPFHRQRIVMAAEKVPGVASVEERVRVEPELRSDEQVRQDVQAALKHDRATRGSGLEVTVEAGVVTLSGTVESRAVSQEARSVAESIRGVRTVFDRTDVEDDERGDQEIKTDLQIELAASIVVDEPIEVSVQDRTAHLSGTVDTAFERTWAIRKAWTVRGVREVDASQLRVNPLPDPQTNRAGAPSPNQVGQAVRAAMRNDAQLRGSLPEIDISGETVTLRGQVPTLAAKRRAEYLSGLVAGVSSVDNQLEVTERTAVSDQDIRDQAQAAFERSVLIEADDVELQVKDGRIVLSGEVDTPIEKEEAESLAAQVAGVMAITNNLEVHPQREWMNQQQEQKQPARSAE